METPGSPLPLEEALKRYIRGLSDPTRGAILLELEHAEELTATQLARRLALTANNVYHHMRVLLEMGVVAPPRSVPGPTYVEKYYRLQPDLKSVVRGDAAWLDRTQAQMSAQERKVLFIGMCLTMSQLLQRAARRYEAMDAEAFDRLSYQQRLGLVSINELSRPAYERRLGLLRDLLAREQAAQGTEIQEQHSSTGAAAESEQPGDQRGVPAVGTDLVLLAGLPLLWEDADGGDTTPK